MPPRSSARGLALATLGPSGIAFRRYRVIAGIVPIAAPLVDVVANIVQSEGVGCVAGDALRASLPASRIIRQRLRFFVAPGKIVLFEVATRRALQLGLRR